MFDNSEYPGDCGIRRYRDFSVETLPVDRPRQQSVAVCIVSLRDVDGHFGVVRRQHRAPTQNYASVPNIQQACESSTRRWNSFVTPPTTAVSVSRNRRQIHPTDPRMLPTLPETFRTGNRTAEDDPDLHSQMETGRPVFPGRERLREQVPSSPLLLSEPILERRRIRSLTLK